MPAFAQHSGGMLTDDQIDVIVQRDSKPLGETGRSARRQRSTLCGAGSRRSEARRRTSTPFTARRATAQTDTVGKRASSIVDGSYLALVSDQNLRTTVIVGRREWGAPDWRGDVPGKPMSPEDVSDVVAWLVAQRTQFPGQPYYSALRTEGGIR